jgi:hypothetical protein
MMQRGATGPGWRPLDHVLARIIPGGLMSKAADVAETAWQST